MMKLPRIPRWLCALVSLTLGSTALQAGEETIPLVRSEQNLLYAKMKVGGREEWVMLDTGAQGFLLSRSLAEALNVPLQEVGATADGIGKMAKLEQGLTPPIELGTRVVLPEQKYYYLKFANELVFEAAGKKQPYVGNVGMNVFAPMKAVLDLNRGKWMVPTGDGIDMAKAYPDRQKIPMVMSRNGLPLLPIEYGGVKGWFLCDTGASHSLFYAASAKPLSLELRDSGHSVKTVSGAVAESKVARVSNLNIGGVNLSGPMDMVVLDGGNAQLEQHEGKPVFGVLGMNLLLLMHGVMDFAHNELLIGQKD